MAVVADRVIVELEAKLDRYEANVRRAEQQFAKASGSISNNAGLVTRSIGRMGTALGALSAFALAREFLAVADASKQMEAQLRLATRTFGTYGQAQADVERIAAAARNGLTETASLYGNLLRATKSLGGTQAEASRATETFSKALKLGGADTQQAASATLQFGQALASGVLRGDEFNSISEASPRILQLLADALGKPRGELRALAEQGKLTSDVLFKALTDTKYTAGIDEEFRTLPVTFGDAMGQVKNAAILTFGAFDRGGEFSTALANFVTDGADGFSSLTDAAEQSGINIRATFAGLTDVFEPLVAAGKSAFASITTDANYARESIGNILRAYDRLKNASNFVINAGNDAVGAVTGYKLGGSTGRSDTAGTFERSYDQSARRGNAKSRQRAAARRLEQQGYVVPIRPDGTVDEANIRRAPTRLAPEPRSASGGGGAKPKGRGRGGGASSAEAARLKDARNDEAFEQEKASLNQDLLRARRATATAADAVATYELQEIEAARIRQNASYDADVSQKKLTEARAAELKAINDKVAAERAAAVNAEEAERVARERTAAANAGIDNAADLLEAERALATSTGQRRDISLRLLDLQKQEEKLRLEAIVASTQATEAEKEIARRRLAILDKLYDARAEGVKQDAEGPLASYRRKLDKTPEDLQRDAEQIVVDQLQRVQDGISNAITKKLGVKDPLLSSILDLFIEQVIMRPLADAFSGAGGAGGGGGIGGLISGIGSLFGGGGGGIPGQTGGIAGPISFGASSLGRLFGGKRASGGHVNAGRIYQINDGGGTEGFQPAGSGKIIPLGRMNRAGGSGMNLALNVSVDNRGSVNPEGFADNIVAAVRKETVGIVSTAVRGVTKGVPGRIAQYQRDGV